MPVKMSSGMKQADAMAWLENAGSATAVAGLARYGLPTNKAFGVAMAVLRGQAKRIGKDHALALKLWDTGWLEARLLASLIGDPTLLTPAQMEHWCRGFDNWGEVDTACFALFDRSPHAWKKVAPWVRRRDEFQKRAGFVLMACLAAHDKKAPDACFLKFMPMIETGANDERNFVKKGVSWALRHLGHRNAALHAAALETATKLSKSEDATERWIGKDALRDITRPLVTAKLKKMKPAKKTS